LHEGHIYVYIYHKQGGGTLITRMSLLTNNVTLKGQWNDKVVGHMKLGKTQRMIGLLCAALKVMSYSF